MTDVSIFLERVRKLTSAGWPLADAVRRVRRADRDLELRVMETIGNWPSSERELAELQRQFP